MSDFFNNGWSLWISGIALLGIIFCLWLLFTQRAFLGKTVDVEETGHVCDGDLTELNTPVPRWWTVMYIGLCVFALGYLVLYPGLGSFKGTLGFTAGQQVKQQQAEINARLEPVYARYRDMPIEEIARDQEAREIGQRLFLNNCAQCHGSDAQGSPSFPNLANKAWLWGGEPEQILHTITEGRTGMMPPQAQFTPAQASDVAQ
ncbi:c-type cytochrome, partial [Providencia rettgeri]|nr:c-type cytochrome [Providencia rettgeri]